jgi:hypothetical protein
MRYGAIIVLLVNFPSGLGAQAEAQRMVPAQRFVSVTAGVGNSLGWFGAQGERYFADDRLSVFLGIGYTPSLDQGDPSGATFAAGLRSFTSGVKHRAFLEGGVSQVLVETDPFNGGDRLYGPGLQGGYEYLSPGGFTFMASLGVGYALAVRHGADPWGALIGLSFGYTWRRNPTAEGRFDRRTK